MKPCWTLLLVAVWLVAPTLAQDEAPEKPRERKKTERATAQPITRDRIRLNSLQKRIAQTSRRLKLDETQQEEFDRIAAEFLEQRPSETDRARQRELMNEMRTARKDNDFKRLQELQTELRGIRSERSMSSFHDQIEPILNDEQRETLNEIRARAASQRGRGRGSLAQLEQLREQLELNQEQAQQYDELHAELKEQVAQARGGSDDLGELIKELRKAAEEGDEERLKELREQLPDSRGNSERLIGEFLTKIERFLEPEQKQTLEQFRREARRGGTRLDVRDYFRYVARLDLNNDQRQAVREIQHDARQAEREARRNPQVRQETLVRVEEQLRDLLTDEQVAEFDRWLEGQNSGKFRRGERGERPRGERGGKRAGEKDKP